MLRVERIATLQWGVVARELLRQWHASQFILLLICAVMALAFSILIAINLRSGIPIAEFTQDPLATSDAPFYKGMLSNIGIVIWSGAAAICLFCYGYIRRRTIQGAPPRFLLFGGIITLVLVSDDLFMLHEVVFPRYFSIAETIVYAAYAALLLWFLVRFRSTILQTDFLLLALAFLGFGASIGVDLVRMAYPIPGAHLIEDGAKLFGIVIWSAYFVLASVMYLEWGRITDSGRRVRSAQRRFAVKPNGARAASMVSRQFDS